MLGSKHQVFLLAIIKISFIALGTGRLQHGQAEFRKPLYRQGMSIPIPQKAFWISIRGRGICFFFQSQKPAPLPEKSNVGRIVTLVRALGSRPRFHCPNSSTAN